MHLFEVYSVIDIIIFLQQFTYITLQDSCVMTMMIMAMVMMTMVTLQMITTYELQGKMLSKSI